MSNETRRSPVEGEQMSHEEGIEAAAEWIERHADTTDSPYVIAKAIIASYLAEAGLVRLDEAVEAVETMYAESNGPNWDFGYNTARAQSAQALRALTAAQPTSEGDSLRAALARCHTLLQDAGHWIDMDAHAEWHEAMDKELSPCDETAVCPTVATSEGDEREAFEAWVLSTAKWKCTWEWTDGSPFALVACVGGIERLSYARDWRVWQARSSRGGGKRT